MRDRDVADTVEVPQLQVFDAVIVLFMDKVLTCPLLCTRNTVEFPTGTVLGQGVHASCCCMVPMARQCRKPVEIPQVQFLAFVMPVVVPKPVENPQVQFLAEVVIPCLVQTVQKTVGRRSASWSRSWCICMNGG